MAAEAKLQAAKKVATALEDGKTNAKEAAAAAAAALAPASTYLGAAAAEAVADAEKEAAAARAAAEQAELAAAAACETPFDRRARVALVAGLREKAPGLLATERAAQLMEQIVELSLAGYFDGDQMNAAASYLLDQHRLARRLSGLPAAARELFFRKKEQIFGAVLAMDTDGDGDISPHEFEAGIQRLGLPLSKDETAQLFAALDADGSGSLEPAELEAGAHTHPPTHTNECLSRPA